MILQSRIQTGNIFSDPRIVNFSRRTSSVDELQQMLASEKKNYQESILLSIFDFNALVDYCNEALTYINTNKESFNTEVIPWLKVILELVCKCLETSLLTLFHI